MEQIITTVAYVIGLYMIFKNLYHFLKFLYNVFLRKQIDLQKRYGKDTYALITGSTDGIGKQFAIELAKQNFNLVLLGRNLQKLEQVRNEIKQFNGKIDIVFIQADLVNSFEPNFFDNIKKQADKYDISLLINNAGIDYLDSYHLIPYEVVTDHIKVNVMPVACLTYHFIKKFQERLQQKKLKSGIINVGSFAGVVPCIYFNVYNGTKGFVNLFSQTLNYEYPEIDIMCLNPLEVSTKMICEREPNLITISSNDCARGALQDLGRENVTAGHWNHKVQTEIYSRFPVSLYNFILKHFIAPDWFRERKEYQKKR